MARKDIKRYSPDDLEAMKAKGDYVPTSPDAPEVQIDEDFWQNARVVMPGDKPKVPVTMRLDADVLAWFKKQGKGYQTRINAVLRTFVDAQRRQ